MQIHYCRVGCCKVKIKPYHNKKYKYYKNNYRKAGVFIYDPYQDRVLLVQSRGHLFGAPKGTLNLGEHNIHGAIREVKEETGLDISSKNFTNFIRIRNKAVYYYLEMPTCEVCIQNSIEDNDANGITWIKVDCLSDAIENGNIVLNNHTKILFHRFLGKKFPKSNWTIVKRKQSNQRNESSQR